MCKDKMAVTLSDDQLPALLDSLKDIPQAVNIRGEIRCKLNSVMTDFDFIVDSWPDYKALVGRVNPTTAKYGVHLSRVVIVYAKGNIALETLLQRPGILDWSKTPVFVYVSPGTMTAVENAIRKQKRPYVILDFFFLTATKDTLKLSPVPDGCKVTRLRQDQANSISSYLAYYKGKNTELYLRNVLEHRQSCCLYNKEGDIVGFAVQYHYGSLGMLYVLEEHRGKGYGKVIMSHLAHSCLQSEREVFAIAEQKNIRSVQLHESIGFKKTPENVCAEVWVNT